MNVAQAYTCTPLVVYSIASALTLPLAASTGSCCALLGNLAAIFIMAWAVHALCTRGQTKWAWVVVAVVLALLLVGVSAYAFQGKAGLERLQSEGFKRYFAEAGLFGAKPVRQISRDTALIAPSDEF